MAVKQEAGNVWQSIHSDIGNTYQAVLTQDSGWKARSSDIGDPMTEGVSQEPGGTFGSSYGEGLGRNVGWGPGTPGHYKTVSPTKDFQDAKTNPSPDSGFGPGKSDQELDRG